LSYLGPLLYHFEDIPNETSFEISYADLRSVILNTGFQIEVTANRNKMISYSLVFFKLLDRKTSDSSWLHKKRSINASL